MDCPETASETVRLTRAELQAQYFATAEELSNKAIELRRQANELILDSERMQKQGEMLDLSVQGDISRSELTEKQDLQHSPSKRKRQESESDSTLRPDKAGRNDKGDLDAENGHTDASQQPSQPLTKFIEWKPPQHSGSRFNAPSSLFATNPETLRILKRAIAPKPDWERTANRMNLTASEADGEVLTDIPKAMEAKRLDQREKGTRYLRHRLQKGFLSCDQAPKYEEMRATDEFFEQLEKYGDLEPFIIETTKVHKVLKAIVGLPSIPRDDEYHFKKRSTHLLETYARCLEREGKAEPTTAVDDNANDGPTAAVDEDSSEQPADKSSSDNAVEEDADKVGGPAETSRGIHLLTERMVRLERPWNEIVIFAEGVFEFDFVREMSKTAACAVVYAPERENATSNDRRSFQFVLESVGPDGEPCSPSVERAELRTAIAALECCNWASEHWKRVIIATSSPYVISGITWIAEDWERRIFDSHSHLWKHLVALINEQARQGCEVVFWRTGAETREARMKAIKKAQSGEWCPNQYLDVRPFML